MCLVQNIKRDPFEQAVGERQKTVNGIGGALGGPLTAFLLGKGDDFDEAMGKWALAYADQAEQDHAALKAAVRAGIIDVELEQ